MQRSSGSPRSIEIMEQALESTSILGETQRENVRLKAEDLMRGRSIWKSTPLCIQIEANRRCQLRCVHCNIDHPWDSEIDFAAIEALFAEIGNGAVEVIPYLRGEPTLAPLGALARLCRRYGNYLNLTTNGILLDRRFFAAVADVTACVTFSFHSHLRDCFSKIEPGADYDRVVRNMRDCVDVAASWRTELAAGIVIMEANIDHLSEWFQFIADLGFRRATLSRLNPNTDDRGRLDCYRTRSDEEIESLVGRAMQTAIANDIFVRTNVPEAYDTRCVENHPGHRTPFTTLADLNSICRLFRPGFCPMVANMVSVTHDGTVRPCCRAHMPIGTLGDRSFSEIWNGDRMQRLRRTFFDRVLFRECLGCLQFICDVLHPSVPSVQDGGVWWAADNAAWT